MCVKCTELDFKIAHYRQLANRITDPLTLDGIAGLIKELASIKAELHPEEKKQGGFSWPSIRARFSCR
jgi:hypothetical protein